MRDKVSQHRVLNILIRYVFINYETNLSTGTRESRQTSG